MILPFQFQFIIHGLEDFIRRSTDLKVRAVLVPRWCAERLTYRAVQAEGLNLDPSGSFLKSVVVTNGMAK
jgi:hypothetical protein